MELNKNAVHYFCQLTVVLYVDKKKIGQLRADNPPGSKFGVIVPGRGNVNKNCQSASKQAT